MLSEAFRSMFDTRIAGTRIDNPLAENQRADRLFILVLGLGLLLLGRYGFDLDRSRRRLSET
jgi:hypothetical protein